MVVSKRPQKKTYTFWNPNLNLGLAILRFIPKEAPKTYIFFNLTEVCYSKNQELSSKEKNEKLIE